MSPSLVEKNIYFPSVFCWSFFLAFMGIVVFITGPMFLPEADLNFVGVISAAFLSVPTLAFVVNYLFTYLRKFLDTRKKHSDCLPGGPVATNTDSRDTKLPVNPKETKLSTIILVDGDGTPPDYVLPPAYYVC
ncbi:unnamed protein product [Orchesella dallaii]|uniref:Uncharacterized protein n=1 Tax=Orchesella dallaii TaxID=48710 RepID=A0ABP1S874_9HEXA